MDKKIKITKKKYRGEDGCKVVSVRMKDELLSRLDIVAEQTNRSRNELINILLEESLKMVTVEDE